MEYYEKFDRIFLKAMDHEQSGKKVDWKKLWPILAPMLYNFHYLLPGGGWADIPGQNELNRKIFGEKDLAGHSEIFLNEKRQSFIDRISQVLIMAKKNPAEIQGKLDEIHEEDKKASREEDLERKSMLQSANGKKVNDLYLELREVVQLLFYFGYRSRDLSR